MQFIIGVIFECTFSRKGTIEKALKGNNVEGEK